MDERQALGFVGKTDRDCIRRFLQDYENPEDGNVEFTKEYVLGHIGNRLNQKPAPFKGKRVLSMVFLTS